jgi:putative ABC transport system substrate-binding protein
MERRDFVALLGGAAAYWPLAAQALQPAKPVIGLLGLVSPSGVAPRLAGFHQGLNETGYADKWPEPDPVVCRYRLSSLVLL